MQGLRSLWSPLLMTLGLLCDNKGPSAVCQQKFRTALTLHYLYGLSSFKQLKKAKLRAWLHGWVDPLAARILDLVRLWLASNRDYMEKFFFYSIYLKLDIYNIQ